MSETKDAPVTEERSSDNQEKSMGETAYFNTEDESALNQLLGLTESANDKNSAENAEVPENELPLDVDNADLDDDAGDEDDVEDSEDDNFDVLIKPTKLGTYKTGNTYQARSLHVATQGGKVIRQGINLNDPGNIQGVPTSEYSTSGLKDEDKPWKQPGADITDYFNYGFTEDTWNQYVEKQRILRQEYANSSLKPVLVGPAVGLNLSGGNYRGSRGNNNHSQHIVKDITTINRARSPSMSEDDTEKSRNGLLGSAQTLNFPSATAFPPPNSGDVLSQFTNALNFPPPGFTNTSLPPPLLGSGFPPQQPSFPNLGNGLIPLFNPNVMPGGPGGRNPSDNSPDIMLTEEDFGSRCSRYRDDEPESRYDRDHRLSRRSRSRSRDYHRSSRSRRYQEDSCHDYGRHGERSSRRHGSRERRHERSRDRGKTSAIPPRESSNAPESSSRSGRNEVTRDSRGRRGGEKESYRSSHRSSRHRRSPGPRSNRSPSPSRRSDLLESGVNPSSSSSISINPLEAVSAAAADISEKLRRS
ncbi:unnamed protein product [Hymenolepis diminuta]|uniref:Pre-mRNA polyadenylation factor Fip1 domain-containing protein n=2 Tax=Hymenolepis diminuta TaxID=6216 RepID=A0A564YVT5_HYMDI|nr:unnamed protein product [Hymenolepis diminuta]